MNSRKAGLAECCSTSSKVYFKMQRKQAVKHDACKPLLKSTDHALNAIFGLKKKPEYSILSSFLFQICPKHKGCCILSEPSRFQRNVRTQTRFLPEQVREAARTYIYLGWICECLAQEPHSGRWVGWGGPARVCMQQVRVGVCSGREKKYGKTEIKIKIWGLCSG